MSERDVTQIPTSLPRDGRRVHTSTHVSTITDARFATYEQQLERLIRSGSLLSEIEEWIDRTPVTEEEQSALWLYAWSLTGHRRGSGKLGATAQTAQGAEKR